MLGNTLRASQPVTLPFASSAPSMDRRKVMVGSDVIRAVIAACFVLTVRWPAPWLLFLLSGLLMFASPFFTAGRAAILPAIANADEIHTANSLTQTTQWTTLTIGTMAAGVSAAKLGYSAAFVLNALSFVFSAWAISRLVAPPGGFRAASGTLAEAVRARPWHEYIEGLRYMSGIVRTRCHASVPAVRPPGETRCESARSVNPAMTFEVDSLSYAHSSMKSSIRRTMLVLRAGPRVYRGRRTGGYRRAALPRTIE